MTTPASLPDPQALGETFHLAWDLAVGGQVLNADHPLVVIQDCWDALVALADGAAQLEAVWTSTYDRAEKTILEMHAMAVAAEERAAQLEADMLRYDTALAVLDGSTTKIGDEWVEEYRWKTGAYHKILGFRPKIVALAGEYVQCRERAAQLEAGRREIKSRLQALMNQLDATFGDHSAARTDEAPMTGQIIDEISRLCVAAEERAAQLEAERDRLRLILEPHHKGDDHGSNPSVHRHLRDQGVRPDGRSDGGGEGTDRDGVQPGSGDDQERAEGHDDGSGDRLLAAAEERVAALEAENSEWEQELSALASDYRAAEDKVAALQAELTEYHGMWCCTMEDRAANMAEWEKLWQRAERAAQARKWESRHADAVMDLEAMRAERDRWRAIACNIKDENQRAVAAEERAGELEAELRGVTPKYPTAEGGPGHEETYWLRRKIQASIIHLRDIEDYYRIEVGEFREGSFYDVRATRARQLYEAISNDLKNGKMDRPSQAEALAAAEELVEKLETALAATADPATPWNLHANPVHVARLRHYVEEALARSPK